MSATGAGYDLAVTTFSPDGRVFQVEYAGKAVEKSGTAIGVRCVDGVVLGVEKLVQSKMLVEGSNRRIMNVDVHCGIAMSGIAGDGKQIVNRARSEARQYREFYGQMIPGKVLNERLAGFIHTYTLYWYLRPFGASVLVASYDDDGPQLHMIEPSGIAYRYFAAAIGKHRMAAKTELEKIKFDQITCDEAVFEIAKILYKLHDDIKDKDWELELSWVRNDGKHMMVPAAIREAAIKMGKEAKDREDRDDDDKPKATSSSSSSSTTTTSTSTAASSATPAASAALAAAAAAPPAQGSGAKPK